MAMISMSAPERLSACDVFSAPERYDGQRVRLADAVIDIAFEGNHVGAYGNSRSPRRIWHPLGYPQHKDGCYWIDASGLLRAEAGGGYGHLGGWDAQWDIETVHAMRPAGRSLARGARSAISRSAGEAVLSVAFPLGWLPSESPGRQPHTAAGEPAVAFYTATRPAKCFVTDLWGVAVVEESLDSGWSPPEADAFGVALEGLLFIALEAGFVSEIDLGPLRGYYARLLDGQLRGRHPEFARWIDAT